MGEMTTYFLSAEELAERRAKRSTPAYKPKKNYRFRTLSKERYESLKAEGLTDEQIVQSIRWLDDELLEKEKLRWEQ